LRAASGLMLVVQGSGKGESFHLEKKYAETIATCFIVSFVNLMGVDGVTARTGDNNRPVDVYFAKGPNLRDEGGFIKNHKRDNEQVV
jgi:hypothetical protein